ncbi:GPR1/FUN34/YaaH-class plasma membrane protein [Physcia stellaris]|nr:GPR1/FUN34/YaaH-class plasma membrane protein [Physcia stellaris]
MTFWEDSEPSPTATMDHSEKEKRFGQNNSDGTFNPAFPSVQNVSEDSGRPNFLESIPYQLNGDHSSEEALKKIRTANTIAISPELFEKLYLSPQTNVKGDLRSKFANPTPIGLLGFIMSLSPLACELMGWRGAGQAGIAGVGSYYFMGGFLMSLGGILEFFLGNTFSFVVFCSFGGFWFTLGSTLTPAFNAYGAYSPDDNIAHGLTSEGFHATYGFFLLFMGLMSLIYLVCALRTNLVFVTIFLGLFLTFVLLAGSYWQLANGNMGLSVQLQVAAAAFGFIATLAGWWIFLAQMLASVDFPYPLPVGDISHLIKSETERKSTKKQFSV